MPSPERLTDFVATVEQGRFVDALRGFYHPDAATRENDGPERRGLATLIAIEEEALKTFEMRTHSPVRVLLDGDDVAIQWIFDMTDRQGRVHRLEEVALQRWRGDRIAEERFFYSPKLPLVEDGA